MNLQTILKTTFSILEVELASEFDRNFSRQAFFDKKWSTRKFSGNTKGILAGRGMLRRSINKKVQGSSILFTSNLPYASIHNEGGKIKVTPKMIRFFWAMYYKATKSLTMNKKGTVRNTQRNRKLTQEAEQWKSLALKKVGSVIEIPKRQFIGEHPQVNKIIEKTFRIFLEEYITYQKRRLMPNY